MKKTESRDVRPTHKELVGNFCIALFTAVIVAS